MNKESKKVNNYQEVQHINLYHKFVVFRGNTEYGDYSDFIDADYPVFAYVYDANERFLPDYTPDWLYKIMDQIETKTNSSYIEHQESMFGMDEVFYNALINNSACVFNGVVTEDEEENIDEILRTNFRRKNPLY